MCCVCMWLCVWTCIVRRYGKAPAWLGTDAEASRHTCGSGRWARRLSRGLRGCISGSRCGGWRRSGANGGDAGTEGGGRCLDGEAGLDAAGIEDTALSSRLNGGGARARAAVVALLATDCVTSVSQARLLCISVSIDSNSWGTP